MSLEGLAGVQAKLAAAVAKMHAEAEAAADESAMLLEAYAKKTAPFKDRTGLLRGSIRGTFGATPSGVRIVISANKTYAPYVELGTHRAKAYRFLWPTVVEQQKNIISIFRRRLSV